MNLVFFAIVFLRVQDFLKSLSAQQSRQRKQKRSDELEILTAQLQLENATLSRRSKFAEQVAKKIREKKALVKKVEEMRLELKAIQHSSRRGLPASVDEIKDLFSGICNTVEGGKSSSDASVLELETSSKDNYENELMQFYATKRNICNANLSQDLCNATNSDPFDVSIGVEVPEFLHCSNNVDSSAPANLFPVNLFIN